ncbi:FAD/NAD-P-binding domain-containing protein [Gloeopeniophorella convolvens]|nr:FAD/NAD-P-binding domain-containing protein [Gloeopeniophorella convolvens]
MGPDNKANFNVVVIGAGFGGLATSIALKTKWKLDNFIIYESGGDVGGTWRDNTYPGAGSDIPVHFYSLSSDLKPDWVQSHGTQDEILAYLRSVAEKYGLIEHCRFNTYVHGATWDDDAGVWRVEIENRNTGKREVVRATAIVSALGVLCVPKFPKLSGADTFAGTSFHSARWRHDVDLRGKRIGVIGNGSSAAQLLPIISRDPSVNVVNFSRTPNWFFPAEYKKYSSFEKWAFAHIPFVMKLHRYIIASTCEMRFVIFRGKKSLIRQFLSKNVLEYMKREAPAEYLEQLIPSYPLGCKRLVRDTDYLSALGRENVRLTFDAIESVEPQGIVTKSGERIPLDVIIYATGFVTNEYPLDIKGPNGTLAEYNTAHGGPMAYLGSTVPGFPNFFMIHGPNTGPGHTSAIFMEEAQVSYLLQLYDPLRKGLLKSIAPTDQVTDKYNKKLQAKLENYVWTQCASWYRVGANGRIATNFPGPLVQFAWWLRKPRWSDYTVAGPRVAEWESVRRTRARVAAVRTICILVTAALVVLGATETVKMTDLRGSLAASFAQVKDEFQRLTQFWWGTA